MSLLDAVLYAGPIPAVGARAASEVERNEKKRYAEILSNQLAVELAKKMRQMGFGRVHPLEDGKGEKRFQGGLGPKRVDVAFSDECHGLLLAVSIKSINAAPFGKNLKNRFADLCTETISLHMRFPYAVVCGLFAFPVYADQDQTQGRPTSTFRKAMKLLATISGRADYTGPGEKFEKVTAMLYQPVTADASEEPWVKLFDCDTGQEMNEEQYLSQLRDLYNLRNPHLTIGEEND